MKKFYRFFLFLGFFILWTGCLSFPIIEGVSQKAVFLPGEAGYAAFRIPSLLNVDGVLFAFAEGRVDGFGDSGNIDIVMKSSFDGGKKWSPLRSIWDDGENTCGNPAPVVIPREGMVPRILMLGSWNFGEDSEAEILARKSRGTRRVFSFYSDDLGASWSAPVDITDQVAREDWTWLATGPGVGLRLTRGEFAGRIVIPSDFYDSEEKAYHSYLFYSDDGGMSWSIGAISVVGTNECQAIELEDGAILVEMRRDPSVFSQTGRFFTSSLDGGLSFSGEILEEMVLQTPVCQAALLFDDVRQRRYFSSPYSTGRDRMTLFVYPELMGMWAPSLVLWSKAAAYSSLAQDDAFLYCLYESGVGGFPYSQIAFAAVDKNLLDGSSSLLLDEIEVAEEEVVDSEVEAVDAEPEVVDVADVDVVDVDVELDVDVVDVDVELEVVDVEPEVVDVELDVVEVE